MGGRKSDVGGEVSSHSVGANVRILWNGEELIRVHFASIHVPWSLVGRIRDEAEKNEANGMMTVELADLKSQGRSVFGEDFNEKFRGVLVRRFFPCVNEKFNARGDDRLSRLPEDVSDSFILLVLAERLKSTIKEDVKNHLDELVRATPPGGSKRPTETAVYQIVHSSILLNDPAPKGSLQEKVAQRSLELLAKGLPDTLNALHELLQLCCDRGRHEIAGQIFKISVSEALNLGGNDNVLRPPQGAQNDTKSSDQVNQNAHFQTPTRASMLHEIRRGSMTDSKINSNAYVPEGVPRLKDHYEHITDQKRREMESKEDSGSQKLIVHERQTTEMEDGSMKHRKAFNSEGPKHAKDQGLNISLMDENSIISENNGNISLVENGKSTGMLAFNQGIVLEKVCKNKGERIIRIQGDTMEWRKPTGRWAPQRRINRADVVNVKVVDPTHRTFLVSTRTGLLTLRAISEESCSKWVATIQHWVKSTPLKTVQQRRLEDAGTTPTSPQNRSSKRFSRLSLSLDRSALAGVPLIGMALSSKQQDEGESQSGSTSYRSATSRPFSSRHSLSTSAFRSSFAARSQRD